MTTRAVYATGFGEKVRVLDDQKTGPVEVAVLRSIVSELTNKHLARAGLTERVDHRTLDEQAGGAAVRGDLAKVLTLSREPTRHHGKSATALLRRGERSDRVMGTLGILAGNVERAKLGHDRAIQLLARTGNASRGGMRPTRISSRPSSRGQPRAPNANLGEIQLCVRATGRDAVLLNSQATVIQEGLRSARDSARAQLEALAATVRNAAALVDAYFRQVATAANDGAVRTHRNSTPEITKSEAPRNARMSPGGAVKRSSSSSRITGRQWAEVRRAQRAALSQSPFLDKLDVKPAPRRRAAPVIQVAGAKTPRIGKHRFVRSPSRKPSQPSPSPRFRRPQP
jgi:hypothetical protein